MKLILLLLIFISKSFSLENNTFKIALLSLNKNVANEKTALKLSTKLFKYIPILKDKKIETFFYKNENDFLNDLKTDKNKFDLIYSSSLIFFRNYKVLIENTKGFHNLTRNDKYEQYYLITNKKSKINSIYDINKDILHFEPFTKNINIWLESIFYKKRKKSINNFLKIKTLQNKLYSTVLDLYFNKIKLVALSKSDWDTMNELNPNILKDIRILEKSPKIFPFIFAAFNKSVDSRITDEYFKYVNDEKNENYISSLLSIVRLNSINFFKKNEFSKAREYYKNYEKLKEKYN